MDVITFPENLTTSGWSMLLHGVNSLSDAKSYDKFGIMDFYWQ